MIVVMAQAMLMSAGNACPTHTMINATYAALQRNGGKEYVVLNMLVAVCIIFMIILPLCLLLILLSL